MLGDPAILHCAAHEQNYLSVTWYKGGKALTPPFPRTIFVLWNNDLLVIANVDNADKYTCELRRGNARISADAWITIKSEIAETPVDATVQFGKSHIFRCWPTGADRITWSKDGRPPSSFIDGKRVLQNRGDLVLTSVTRADSGRYTCTASRDGDAQTIQAEATLVVADVDIAGVCGRPVHAAGPDGLIVGGAEVEPGEFPWQAMLWDIRPNCTRNRFFCSGSLINKRWVITAAHCIRKLYLTKEDFIVRLGKHTTVPGMCEANERSNSVDRIIVHPYYNDGTLESDVALLRLAPPEVTFTEYILPICLPEVPEARRLLRPGAIGTVTGWGAQVRGGRASEKLMKVSLPVVTLAQCRESHPEWAQDISQNMFCAGRREGEKDSCDGDSGGPFAAFDNGRWNLLGVVSWGDGCALRGKYGGYTRLHRFREWIMEHTEEHVCGRPVHGAGPGGLIAGGTEVEPGAFPWQAMLWDTRPAENSLVCSGSLINKRWVITAAHCIRKSGLTKENFQVRLGKHTSVHEAKERSYNVDRIIVHPEYNKVTLESDVALLRLAPPEVTFTEYILPICLPEVPEARRLLRPGAIGTVTGWGALVAGGRASEKLMKVSLPVVNLAQCRESHPQWADTITENVFCAGRGKGGEDVCEGDSGGPFAAFDNGRWHLLGVVSWGEGCALRGKYGVYTRLDRFWDWIMEHTEELGR
ncbi:transmembrane protease serine 9-like [Branchiostoma lanceolatum]|uniref:transmembrane protease serine 9-like n=1 Tax=Branchiostoma lanceolatum TaxID=7740 RepID=UPI003454AA8A